MAIGGAFLGGGVEVVPAGSCKLELEILTEDRANLTATFTIKGTSTYSVTAGADGRAVYTVPAGQTYTVSVNTTGYDNLASQTVIAESGTVRYVRFEAFSGRVKRSGDTMTGMLTSEYSNIPFRIKHAELEKGVILRYIRDIQLVDKNNAEMGTIRFGEDSAGTGYISLIARNYQGASSQCKFHVEGDGSSYLWTPSWSPGTNDNSDKILTIKMANSLPSLVHTTGNETISGIKTFTSKIVEQKSSDMGMEMLSTSFDRSATFTSYQRPVQFIAKDKNNNSVLVLQTYVESNNRRGLDLTMYDGDGNVVTLALKSDGTKIYATAPTTPSSASGSEIATADWVLARINELATKNKLTGL